MSVIVVHIVLVLAGFALSVGLGILTGFLIQENYT